MEREMILKPQDVLIAAKLVVIGDDKWSYGSMATTLWMSPSEVHAGVKRLIKARLASALRDCITPECTKHGIVSVLWTALCICT